jgi:Rha family phage regulatory protein
MSKLVLHPEYHLYERDGTPFCDSRQVAETFEKRHDNVLRDIETKILGVAPKNFTDLNFEVSYYRDESGKRNKEYLLTRDAFSLVAMGFTGEKAMAFKIAYIERFNQMEGFIKYLRAAKLEHPAFTEAIMLAHPEPKHYHFSNEADMINRIVLGVSAKQFKQERGLQDTSSIRPYLDADEIRAIETLQRADVGMLAILPEFERRKAALSELYGKMNRRRVALREQTTKAALPDGQTRTDK